MSEESAEEVAEEMQEEGEETSEYDSPESKEYEETSENYSANNSSESEETSEYNSPNSEEPEEPNTQEEDTQEKENKKENLESRLKEKSNIVEKFYSKLESKGYSKEKIAELLADKESLYAAENLPNSIRSLIYLIEGFLENGDIKDRDVYKRIDESEGTIFLFFPGLMRFPYSAKQLEKNTGLNIIRVDEKDPDEIEKIVDYAAKVSGQKPAVIGYSDGRIEAEKCANGFREKTSGIFVIAGNKTIENIVYIDGGVDALAPLEKGYHTKIDEGSVRIVLTGMGHVDMVYNPRAIQQIGDILRAYTRASSVIRSPEANNTSGSYSEASSVINIPKVSNNKAYSEASNVTEMPDYIEMRKAA